MLVRVRPVPRRWSRGERSAAQLSHWLPSQALLCPTTTAARFKLRWRHPTRRWCEPRVGGVTGSRLRSGSRHGKWVGGGSRSQRAMKGVAGMERNTGWGDGGEPEERNNFWRGGRSTSLLPTRPDPTDLLCFCVFTPPPSPSPPPPCSLFCSVCSGQRCPFPSSHPVTEGRLAE